MIGMGSPSRIFLYRGVALMRKGFDSLAGIVRGELEDELSITFKGCDTQIITPYKALWGRQNGTPSWDRTSDLLLRRQLLCPTELLGYK